MDVMCSTSSIFHLVAISVDRFLNINNNDVNDMKCKPDIVTFAKGIKQKVHAICTSINTNNFEKRQTKACGSIKTNLKSHCVTCKPCLLGYIDVIINFIINNRFFAVTSPILYSQHRHNTSPAFIVILACWATSLAIGLPIMCGLNHRPEAEMSLVSQVTTTMNVGLSSWYLLSFQPVFF